MCGIFGLIAKSNANITESELYKASRDLFLLSESRGKESAGIAIRNSRNRTVQIFKKDLRAKSFLKRINLRNILVSTYFQEPGIHSQISLFGHCRLVTNGTQENHFNNQPVSKDGTVLVHNGIICNVDNIWESLVNKEGSARSFDVDSEVIAELFNIGLKKNQTINQIVETIFKLIEGTASIALFNTNLNQMVLASNNGSLYFCSNHKTGLTVFGSEEFIVKEFLRKNSHLIDDLTPIQWVDPSSYYVINLSTLETSDKGIITPIQRVAEAFKTEDVLAKSAKLPSRFLAGSSASVKLLEFNVDRIRNLKRCLRCVLPETFPFISFNNQGICNYCSRYEFKKGIPKADLESQLDVFRKPGLQRDCLVAFSGGRDSSYGLHLLVKEFGMKPLTFTYDWGLITDLARRNIARICGELGLENILVSADINAKRRYVRKNLLAWLKAPQLGMIPLLMAGDKHFFNIVNIIKKQTGITFDIWMANKYENTDFKTGFCGIPPEFDKKGVDSLSIVNKLRLPTYYLKNFVLNPAYLNESLWDTMTAYWSYYFEPRYDHCVLFNYLPWRESEVENVLISEYNWELSKDTKSSWRIGDGTAAFYNYVYYTIAGFSEVETFRSNQIRDGAMSRETALSKIYEENQPRFESLKWYLDILKIDFDPTIKQINSQPKLYK